jgi:hypothetical protein
MVAAGKPAAESVEPELVEFATTSNKGQADIAGQTMGLHQGQCIALRQAGS